MAKASWVFIVGTVCTEPSREQEFNEWYNKVHIPELCRSPGIKGAQRYQILDPEEGYPQYIAIYEVDGEEGMKSFNEHIRKQQRGEVPALTKGPPFQVVWRKAFKHIGP